MPSYTLDQLKGKLEDTINSINWISSPVELYQPIAYALSLGGKRIRPLLVLLGNNLFNGNIEQAIPPAIGIELFHNFTLLHDDIMDQAPLRRGKETVYRKWNLNAGVLSGDTMFALSYQYIANIPPRFLPEVLSLFNTTAREVCEGQQLDMNFETLNNVSIDDYLNMIRLKTAVLLACSLKIGAITGQANSQDADLLYSFGENLGMAFQLQDDLLDVYGDETKFGKKIGGDIISGKKTYLYLEALELLPLPMHEILVASYNDKLLFPAQKIEKVKTLFDQIKVEEYTRKQIDLYFIKALLSLEKLNVSDTLKTDLRSLSESLLGRQY